MIREYKTIQEISGPLMVVKKVQGVTYDELAEIELTDGSVRRCKVLEVNGDSAVVQLFEKTVTDYTPDKVKRLKIIEIATISSYRDANWAINKLGGGFRPGARIAPVDMTTQKVCTGTAENVTF